MPLPEHAVEAERWRRRAVRDLKEAKLVAASMPDSPNAIWLAQQAAEKAIKSVLILNQIDFPKRGRSGHDLRVLATLLPASALTVDEDSLEYLTSIGIGSRYPELDEPGIPEVK